MSPDHSIICQLINFKDGTRSGPMTITPAVFAEHIKNNEIPEGDNMGLIILMEKDPAPDRDWEYSTAPLQGVQEFISAYSREAIANV